MEIAASTLVVIVPYLLSVGVAAGVTLFHHPHGPGFLWWSLVSLGIFQFTLSVVVGFLIGRTVPHRGLALAMVISAGIASIYYRVTFGVLSVESYQQLSPSYLALCLFATLALVGLAASIRSRRLTPDWGRRLNLGWIGIGAVVAVILAAGGSPLMDRDPSGRIRCSGNRAVALCAWKDDVKYVGSWQEMASRIHRLPEGLRPSRLVLAEGETGALQGDSKARIMTIRFTTDLGNWGVASAMAAGLINQSIPMACWTSQHGSAWVERLQTYAAWMTSYVFGNTQPSSYGGGSPEAHSTAVVALLRSSTRDQVAWGLAAVQSLRETC